MTTANQGGFSHMIFSTESEDGEAPVFFNARNHYSNF